MAVLTPEQIEMNKDRLNLRPALAFVERNLLIYRGNLDSILAAEVNPRSRDFALSVQSENAQDLIEPQLSMYNIVQLLSRMPPVIRDISHLKTVSYFRGILVPKFDQDGNFMKDAESVSYDEFPRPGDHHSRVLVGISNGETIYPSPIPRTVSNVDEAIYMYQVHVFLHEFFHTVLKETETVLESGGKLFTLNDLINQFGEIYQTKRKPVSFYAGNYSHLLNMETREKDAAGFRYALIEQICESFAGYILGITPNESDAKSFQAEFIKEWNMIDLVCCSEIKN